LLFFYYFSILQGMEFPRVALILAWSVLGILGSFGVAWFGIRINNYANSRTAFASLEGKAYPVYGHSSAFWNVCWNDVDLCRALYDAFHSFSGAQKRVQRSCFVGFAIGESLGAAALRICGGIFTKIADIGSDLMKIVFQY
jgi:K(+)-stimulated pyrophosphate-energized sodium pump